MAHVGLLALAVLGASAFAPPTARADGRAAREERPEGPSRPVGAVSDGVATVADEATRAALARGLDWLAGRARGQADRGVPVGPAQEAAPVAVTALSALAWMAAGSGLERGPHGSELAGAIDWLLAHVESTPDSPRHGYIADSGDALSRMHGHGFATLALAEAYAVSPQSARGRKLEEALIAAVKRIEVSQHSSGGWGYEPIGGLMHEGSVTICLVQALRAARNSGLTVDTKTIGRAIEYVEKSQKEDGSFRYSLADERSSVALTAAAVSTLNATGDYASAPLAAGLDYVFRELAARENGVGTAPEWPMYERLYLAQALWQHGDEQVFARWFAAERPRLIREQREDGSWASERYGSAYATAMACLVLAIPEQLLPIFQR